MATLKLRNNYTEFSQSLKNVIEESKTLLNDENKCQRCQKAEKEEN